MTISRPPDLRGQALVEAVLGILVFVVVFTFGIHFAEVGYMALKVQEAATSALWDMTASRVHGAGYTFPGGAPGVIAQTSLQANGRYQDFDGRVSVNNGAGLQGVMTLSGVLTIQCASGNGPSFDQPTGMGNLFQAADYSATCGANAVTQAIGIPGSSLGGQNGTLFRLTYGPTAPLLLCAVGTPNAQACNGDFGIMLDDWGLIGSGVGLPAGQSESAECTVGNAPGCAGGNGNTGFYNAAKSVYDAAPAIPIAASLMAATFTFAPPPIDESQFWMSFRGEESNFSTYPGYRSKFVEPVAGFPHGYTGYPTSPGGVLPNFALDVMNLPVKKKYLEGYNLRTNCFLGQTCPL